jgi:cardiolipin synthase
MNIPNSLSIFRIILIPIFVVLFFTLDKELVYIPVLVLVLSGITDVADGFVARKFNQITYLGKILDPLADKLTLFFVLGCLAIKDSSILLLATLYFIKEFSMGIGGIIIMKSGKKIASARWFGKATTMYIYGAVVLILLKPAFIEQYMIFVIWIAMILVVFSFIMYVPEYVKIMKNNNEKIGEI